MEQSRRTRRVSFSDTGRGKIEKSTRSRGRSKSESFRDEEKMKMKDDYNGMSSEFAASIAAAAYAIYSLEETRAEYERLMVDSFRESFRESAFRDPETKSKSFRGSFRDPKTNSSSFRDSFRKSINLDQDHTAFDMDLPYLGRSARRSSSQTERQDAGEGARRTSTRPIEISGADQQRGVRRVETKADAWERARLEKINKWYEKMNKKILEWENEKKKRAAVDMEKRKAELDRLKRMNLHHYANKIQRIEDVSGGARKQLEEKKKSEEAYVHEKAKKIRSTGKVTVQCFCFEY